MDEKQRIEKDIQKFEKLIVFIEKQEWEEIDKKIIELAKTYYNDTMFFVEKQDYFTAFGAINYAHGLLDTFRFKIKNQINWEIE